jgi:uncharacterized damage-inducible protein DinB
MTRPPPPEIPLQADERTMLNAFLDFYRAALVDRALELDHAQLQTTLPPSTLTLSRLVGHMIMVEDIWFRQRLDGDEPAEPFASLDWEADVDAEMTVAQTWPVDELFRRFEAAVADSRARVAAASTLDQLSVQPDGSGQHWSLRWILIHMIEEYARHCGHADLIRESIDGDLAD